MNDIFLIKKPILTEKATDIEKIGKYVFLVKSSASKNEIKKIVKKIYGVDVADVNTINIIGKTKRFRNVFSKNSGYKKAVVTVKKGQKINIT